MSGIAAIFNRDRRPVELRAMEAMLDAISYRGPDGHGIWAAGHVALGQRMSHSTLEAVAERQPWSDDAAGSRLVFDGRIDNRADLRRRLAAAGFEPRTDGDAELVLRSYQCWGEGFAVQLLGDFALVIWDSRTETLIGARDPSGIKPFFYHAGGDRFVCGSELHQLFCCDVPREPNEAMVGEYLAVRTLSASETLYRSIRQLLPAHLLIVRRDHLSVQRYYDLDPAIVIRHRDDNEYADHFLSLFKEAVRCRMRAAGPVAADLSGGIDSSSVVAIAQMLHDRGEARCEGLESFSEVFPGLACDESEYIKAVGAKCGVPLNLEPPLPAVEIDLAAQVRQFKDFPSYPNFASGLGFRRLQKRKGARVALTGEGGDEWFSGSIDDNADRLRALRIFALVRQLRIDASQSETRLMRRINPLRLLIKTAVLPLLPPAARELVQKARGRLPYPPWVSPALARRIDLYARLVAPPRFPHIRGVARRLIYETFHAGEIPLTLGMLEQGTARLGLEVRHPFFDRRLIEFAFAVPSNQLRRDGFERYIVRNAMHGILPEVVRTRITKASFNQPVLESVQYNAARISFDRLEIAERGWVDAAKLKSGFETLMASFRNDQGDYGVPVWMAIAMEIWHRVVFGSGKFDR